MTTRSEASIQPRDVSIPVAGGALSARVAACDTPRGAILAIHGGGYTARYFDVPGQSFLRLAAAAGYWTAAIDRPGYGAMRDRPMPFDGQVPMLRDAGRWLLAEAGAGLPLFLHGHSIGGMLALLLAGAETGLPIAGLAMTGAGAVYREKAASAVRARAASAESHSASMPDLRRLLMMGPGWSYDPALAAFDAARDVPTAVADLRDAMAWGERFPAAAARCAVPALFVVPEHDALWRSDALDGVAGLFAQAPFVEVRVQRMAGHAVELHRMARAHACRVLAFADECRLHRERAQ
jgi:alpha-beta hydrolase superfamily lysophospholipase